MKACQAVAPKFADVYQELEVYTSSNLDQADDILKILPAVLIAFADCANFIIKDREHVVPMAVEGRSWVAAASHMAKLAHETGQFHAATDSLVMHA